MVKAQYVMLDRAAELQKRVDEESKVSGKREEPTRLILRGLSHFIEIS